MIKDLFNKYIWLVDTIYRAERITFEEINARWRRTSLSNNEDIPLRTFHRWTDAIEDMFDINIECDRKNGYAYYIENADEVLNDDLRNWLLDTFTIQQLISESRPLKHRILLEEIPSGRKFLTSIVESMRDGRELSIHHQSFTGDSVKVYTLQPYCIKLFRQRWYVLGFCKEKESIRILSLDRIHSLQLLETTFDYPSDFVPSDYFKECFGIIADDGTKQETIVLKAYGLQCAYLRALPLHHSQIEVETGDDYCIFQYQVRPTFDFRQALLSKGSEVEVLEPIAFREEVKNEIDKLAKRYFDVK